MLESDGRCCPEESRFKLYGREEEVCKGPARGMSPMGFWFWSKGTDWVTCRRPCLTGLLEEDRAKRWKTRGQWYM